MPVWGGLVIYQLNPGSKAQATTVWQERVLPFLSQQRGLRGAYWMIGQDGDRAFSIDIWDSDLAMSAYESSGLYKKLMSNFDLLLAHAPARTQCRANEFLAAALASDAKGSDRPAGPEGPPKPEGMGFKLLKTIRKLKP